MLTSFNRENGTLLTSEDFSNAPPYPIQIFTLGRKQKKEQAKNVENVKHVNLLVYGI